MNYFFFLFFLAEFLLEKLSAVQYYAKKLHISLHGQQGPAPNTEKIQLEHYDQPSSKTDHALLKAVVQAALLKPSFDFGHWCEASLGLDGRKWKQGLARKVLHKTDHC